MLDLAGRGVVLPRGVTVTAERLGGRPSASFEDCDADRARAVLHLHGGAYTTGSIHTHRGFAAGLSAAARVPVHLLEYRLAPEHPYPAAVEDSLAAYRELAERTGSPGRVVLSGDSAGAALALVVARRLFEAGEEVPAGIVLACPWLDLTLTAPSLRSNLRRDAGLWAPGLRDDADAYAAGADQRLPELSPIEADLEGMPPLYVQSAAQDVLLNDAERFVRRAREAGVLAGYRRFEGLWHDFQVATGVSADAHEALGQIAAHIDGFWRGED